MIEGITLLQGISRQFKVEISPAGEGGPANRFTLGQVLQGLVLQQMGDHRFLMDFNGMEVIAESTVPLKPGQQIAVRVDLTHPRVLMSPTGGVTAEEKALALLRSLLPGRSSWGELVTRLGTLIAEQERSSSPLPADRQVLEKIVTLLSSLAGSEEKTGDAAQVRRFMEDTGIFYESKLRHALVEEGSPRESLREAIARDCKGMLLKLSQDLKHAPEVTTPGGVETQTKNALQTLVKAVDESLDNIELQQLVNCLAAKKEEQLVFQIPVLLPEGMRTAELYIRSGGRGDKRRALNPEDLHLVFLLAMESLGDLRIDAHMAQQKIRCAIEVGTPEGARFVKQHLDWLSERLARLDFTVEHLSCTVTKPGPHQRASLEGFSLLEMKLIDIRA